MHKGSKDIHTSDNVENRSNQPLTLPLLLALSCLWAFLVHEPAHAERCSDQPFQPEPDSLLPFNIYLGLRGMVSWTSFYGEDADTVSGDTTLKLRSTPTIGIVAGFLSEKEIFKWRGGVEFDFSYMTKGAGLEVAGEEVGSFDSRYYDLALLLHFRRSLSRRLSAYSLVGPGLSFLREATIETTSGFQEDITSDLSATDWNAIVGVGVSWAWQPNHKILFDLRTNIGTRTIDATPNNTEMNNIAISLSLGYQWSYPPRQRAASCPDP